MHNSHGVPLKLIFCVFELCAGKTMMRRSEDVSQSEVRRLQMNLAAVHEARLVIMVQATTQL